MFSPSRWCPNIAGCSICCQSSKQPAPANFFYGKNVWPTKKISSHPNSNLARDQSWKSWRVCMYIYIERPFVRNKKRVSTSQCRRQPSLGSITVKSLLWWREHIATHILIPQTFLNKGEGRASGNRKTPAIIWSPYSTILTLCDWILNWRINGHWDHVRLFTRFSTLKKHTDRLLWRLWRLRYLDFQILSSSFLAVVNGCKLI